MALNGFKGLVLSVILVSLPGMAAAQPVPDQIVIVKSSDNAYFDKTIATLLDHVNPGAQIRVTKADRLASDHPHQDRDRLYIALGPAAVRAIRQNEASSVSINAYLTHEQYNELEIAGQTTILLDQPLDRYLAFSKLILGAESIGVITAEELELGERQQDTLDTFQLRLNQYQVDPLNKLLPVLRELLQHNDALLMLPRQSIYNQDTLKGVLLVSYRNRKPVVSYSPAHVKSGAVASIYSSPVDIGRHLALTINQKLQSRAAIESPIQFARFYSIATNPTVARALEIELAGEQELRARLDRLAP